MRLDRNLAENEERGKYALIHLRKGTPTWNDALQCWRVPKDALDFGEGDETGTIYGGTLPTGEQAHG